MTRKVRPLASLNSVTFFSKSWSDWAASKPGISNARKRVLMLFRVSAGRRKRDAGLVRGKRRFVVLLQAGVLVRLVKKAIADGHRFNFRAHEAMEGVLRGADDGLPADVETGIHHHRTAGLLFECADQRVITRIGFAVH